MPFELMRQRVAAIRAAGKNPVVVLDLDHTLFDNGPRTCEILLEYALWHNRQDLGEAVIGLGNLRNLPYLFKDIVNLAFKVQIPSDLDLDEIGKFWKERFFHDEYLKYDVPIEGAAEFARGIRLEGAHLVYLTGRDRPNMMEGTVRSLGFHGFPVPGDRRVTLILKPSFNEPDEDFKRDAVSQIGGMGDVVGFIDNEPAMCQIFRDAFPRAVIICYGDICFKPMELPSTVYRVKSFPV